MATECPPGEDTQHDHLTANLDVTTLCPPGETLPEAGCAVCEGPFRLPKLLDCLHSVCEPCVKRCLSAGNDGVVVVCPVKDCSEHTRIPHGLILALRTNYLLLSSQQSNSRTCLCCECVDDEEAESYCEECGVRLCSLHALSHRKSRSTAQHTIQEINSENAASQRTGGPQQRRILCPFHGEDMSLFCRTCDYLCCSQCTRGVHREHNVEPTSEVSAGVMADLREKLTMITTATDEDEWTAEEVIEEGNRKLDEIKDQAEATSKQITVRIGEVKMALEEKERRLLQKVDTLKNHRECELEQSIYALQKTSLTFKVAVETTEKALSHLAPAEQLSFAPVLRQRLLQAQTNVTFAKEEAAKIVQKNERIDVASTALSSKAVIKKIEESFSADEIRSNQGLVDGRQTTVAALNHTNWIYITCRNSQKQKLFGEATELGLDLAVVMPSGKSISLRIGCYRDDQGKEGKANGEVESEADVTSFQTQDLHEDMSANSNKETSEKESIDAGATHYIHFEPEEVGQHTVHLNYIKGKQDGIIIHRFMIVDKPAMQFSSLSVQSLLPPDRNMMTFTGGPEESVLFTGDVTSTSEVVSWRLQLWGLSELSRLSIGASTSTQHVRQKQTRDPDAWVVDFGTSIVGHRAWGTDRPSRTYISPYGRDFPKLKDGDILFCWLCRPQQVLWITHEASEVSVIIVDMSMTDKIVSPCVILSSPKHRVVSLPPGLQNEEI